MEYTVWAKILVVCMWLSAFGFSITAYRKFVNHSERVPFAAFMFLIGGLAPIVVAAALCLVWFVLYGSYYVLTN